MTKILILGWDGATFDWIKMNPGVCKFMEMWPIFDRLLPENDYVGRYIDSGNAWTTITTGTEPKQHGIEDFYHIWTEEGKKVKQRPVNNDLVRYKRLWDYMPDIKSFIFNIPVTWPVKPLNGIIMTGGPNPGTDLWYPNEYNDKYQCPKYRPKDCSFNDWFWKDDLRMERIKYCQNKRHNVVKEILKEHEPQFAFIHMHCIDTWSHRPGTHLEEVYKMIDIASAELYALMKPDKLIMLSDHGMNMAHPDDKKGSPWLVMNHDSTSGIYAGNIQLDMNLQSRIVPNILSEIGILNSPKDFKPQKITPITATREQTMSKEEYKAETNETLKRLKALGYMDDGED